MKQFQLSKHFFAGLSLALCVLVVPVSGHSQALVVLEYPGMSDAGGQNNDHPFVNNPNHTARHEIQKDETLGEILHTYYGGSGLNMQFVELAVVKLNKSAFVRGNPNFMYAEKHLHLPSLNDIDKLIRGRAGQAAEGTSNGPRDEIFFIGG